MEYTGEEMVRNCEGCGRMTRARIYHVYSTSSTGWINGAVMFGLLFLGCLGPLHAIGILEKLPDACFTIFFIIAAIASAVFGSKLSKTERHAHRRFECTGCKHISANK